MLKYIWVKNLWFEFIIKIRRLKWSVGFYDNMKYVFDGGSVDLFNYKVFIIIGYIFLLI